MQLQHAADRAAADARVATAVADHDREMAAMRAELATADARVHDSMSSPTTWTLPSILLEYHGVRRVTMFIPFN